MIDTTALPSLPVSRSAREKLKLTDENFDSRGYLKIPSPRDARKLSILYARTFSGETPPASDLYGAACIVTAWRLLLDYYTETEGTEPYEKSALEAVGNSAAGENILRELVTLYPDEALWTGRKTPGEALDAGDSPRNPANPEGREGLLRRWTLAVLADEDPAFTPFGKLFFNEKEGSPETDSAAAAAPELWKRIVISDEKKPPKEPENTTVLATLRKPVESAPNSVKAQLLYILEHWGPVLGDWVTGLITALDMIEEEQRPRFGGPGPAQNLSFSDLDGHARFSSDDDWMPRVVLIAKNVLVWLDQLSKSYGRRIKTLDAIPDEELSLLSSRGFNALWLIGLWERSSASREIKQRMGNPEAAASAYSLFGYDIAAELGGWDALKNLRNRAEARGIRLSSDMVPNHVGLDSDWVRNHPDRLLSSEKCPFPAYTFNSDNLSRDERVDIRLEDHYWDRSDAAVVFKRTDTGSGETRYVYHGNDGTTMPWNDTAQIDFLNPEAREAVIQDILHVARNFPVIRFDAAMVLARKHIRRLWFPSPGAGGAIPSRSEYALSDEEFMKACPREFWREVVDRVKEEVPGTLLLAEAFWMMEGYFVRTLGMHRVYNSAFMNMLRDGKNREYRDIIKETLAFDPGILQRFVNFMNNPDEETAVEQFGKDDRYFAACTLLSTLPGLPMFGHGQIEGLSEKYGMEYVRAYREEQPDSDLIARHEREIFPLLHRRALFADAGSFRLYDLQEGEAVNENVFIYSNSSSAGKCLVVVNNSLERASGQIFRSTPVNIGNMQILNESLDSALGLKEAGGNDWLLMKDNISGLWYLRSVSELRDSGLFLVVDGFGRQVFMDFRSEKETPEGLWEKLAGELNGAGIMDPDRAIAEIRLRPIHQLLDRLFPPELVLNLTGAVHRGRKPHWPPEAEKNITGLLAELEKVVKRLFPEARQGSAEIFPAMKKRLEGSSRQFRFFGGGIRRKMKRLYELPLRDEALFLVLWSLFSPLSELMPVNINIIDAWNLETRLNKFNFINYNGRNFSLLPLKVALSPLFNHSHHRDIPNNLTSIFANSDVRKLCGVNEWNDILWYDKEGWIMLLQIISLVSGADAGSGRKRRNRYRRIKKQLKFWYRADRKAEYRLNRLLGSPR